MGGAHVYERQCAPSHFFFLFRHLEYTHVSKNGAVGSFFARIQICFYSFFFSVPAQSLSNVIQKHDFRRSFDK